MRVSLAMLMTLAPAARATVTTCLQTSWIEHADVLNDRALVLYMVDGPVWQIALPSRCVGLHADRSGFSYEPFTGSDEICSNLATIRLNTTGKTCRLGAFERLR